MGFSDDNFNQYRKEIRIMWRVLAVGVVVAGGVHVFSLPWISRMVSGPPGEEIAEIEATPIEIVVEEELVQQTPEPEPEEPEENPEPAASADKPSAAPLATAADPVPTSEVAAADTVAVTPAIATENGAIAGQGAVGESSVIGMVTGSGNPTEVGDRINLPESTPPPDIFPSVIQPKPQLPTRSREPVQEIALARRRPPTSRLVSCNPCTSPDYPTTARREKVEGQPVVSAIFDANGRVIEAVIEVSSGNAAFDRAALEEAKKNWRFQDPQGLGGQVSVDVVYVIDDSEQYEAAQQAGEIRAVELPIDQQVQRIAPDQPLPSASSAPVNSSPSQGAEEIEQVEPESVLDSSEPADPESVVPEPVVPEPVEVETPAIAPLPDPPVPPEPIVPIEPPPIPQEPLPPAVPIDPPAPEPELLPFEPSAPVPSAPEPSAPEPSAPEQ